MRKIRCFVAIALVGVVAFAQTITLTFAGRDAANHYVQLNRVSITNLTKGWQETIYWPDTTLTMQNGTGIDESVANGGFVLSQNNPNPFSGTTDVNLTVADAGVVTLEIVDGNGKIVETRHGTSLQPGTNQFRVSLSTAGTYVMTARQNGKTSSIKMVCNGADATINGTEVESQRITQAQGASQTFVLQFPVVQNQTPTVTTTAASNVTETSATCGGTVTADGGANVIVRGVCYSTSPATTTADNHTTDGSGTGSFTSSLTGLTANTTYYVRAYATNSVGTAYGNEMSFTTTIAAQLPTVTTTAASNVTETSATCGGTVTSDGGANVIVRGVCYSTSPAPTTADNHTTDGSGTGSFTSSLTGLTANTTYYVRAYATNNVGTAYGNEVSFTTTAIPTTQDGQPCPNTPTLSDIDGNTYNTVQIGQQCWMKENLRTTHYANSSAIEQGSSTSTTTPYWYYPNNDANNMSTYGLLYNWVAVMNGASSSYNNPSGVQGICPTGWHVPSDTEWTQLTNYVSSQSQYVCGSTNTQIAKALAGDTGWTSSNNICAVGKTPSNNNVTGFSALPAGLYYGSYDNLGKYANFWSATDYSSTNAYYLYLSYAVAPVTRGYNYKNHGYSVRCLRD